MIYTVRQIIQNTSEGVKEYEYKEECLEWIKKYEKKCFYVDRCGHVIKRDMSYNDLDWAVKTENEIDINKARYLLQEKAVGFVEKFFQWKWHGDAYYTYKDRIAYEVHQLEKELQQPYAWNGRKIIEDFPDNKYLPKHKDFRKCIEDELVQLQKLFKKKIHDETLMFAIYEYREYIKKQHMRLLKI